jgi:hypothetical protein
VGRGGLIIMECYVYDFSIGVVCLSSVVFSINSSVDDTEMIP